MVYRDEDITKLRAAEIYDTLPPEPPELRVEDRIRGGHGLRILKTYCDELYRVNRQYYDELQGTRKQVQDTRAEREQWESKFLAVSEELVRLKGAAFAEQSYGMAMGATGSRDLEQLLIQETDRRIAQEGETARLQRLLQEGKDEFQQYKLSVKEDAERLVRQTAELAEHKETIENLSSTLKEAEFDRDSATVALLGAQRDLDMERGKLADTTQKLDYLTQVEQTLREENEALQKRLREVLDSNKELTKRYQLVRKNNVLKRSEFEELHSELQEAKNSCILAIKARRQGEVVAQGLSKDKETLKDCVAGLEAIVEKKNGEIKDLMQRVAETIQEYEEKLELKEVQMTQISSQIVEVESTKKKQTAIAEKSKKAVMDAELLGDMERKFQLRERGYKEELQQLRTIIQDRERVIAEDEQLLQKLREAQFKPRMELLRGLEAEMREIVAGYALELEMLETSLMCPRTMRPLSNPITMLPCGHTYSEEATASLREENFGRLACAECQVKTTSSYANDQLRYIAEHFHSMKRYTNHVLAWIKRLKLDGVDSGEDGEDEEDGGRNGEGKRDPSRPRPGP